MNGTNETSLAEYLTCAETAKLVRAALKRAFPGVKFSVRSDVYAGGASIRVRYTDGPKVADVESVAGRFAGSTFDGSDDSMHYHDSIITDDNGQPRAVHFGANFVFVDRDFSPEVWSETLAALALFAGDERWSAIREWDRPTHAQRALYHVSIPTGCNPASAGTLAADGYDFDRCR